MIATNSNYFSPDHNGLILLLDSKNPRSYPGTGLNWYDLSLQGNHCALDATRPPTFDTTTKMFNFAIANQNRAVVPHDDSFNFGTGDFTILHYSEHPVVGDVVGCVLQKGTRFDANVPGWLVCSHAGNGGLYQVISDGSSRIEMWWPGIGIPTFTIGLHGLLRRNGLLYHVYHGVAYNYILAGGSGAQDSNVDCANDIYIGYSAFYNSYWNGSISKIIIYNRGLSDAELSNLLQRGNL
jgi:hypothetical protein